MSTTTEFDLGPDGVAEEEAILERLRANLVGGRVYDQITDELIAPAGDVREVAPYIVVDFGAAYPSTRDRIVGAGELSQPYVMAVSVSCWASRVTDARRIAGAVRRILIDWQPTETALPLAGMGSSGFTVMSARQLLPSRSVRQVFLLCTFNTGIPEPA